MPQIVKPASKDMAAKLSKAYGVEINKGTRFEVLVTVESGVDYKGRACAGLIVRGISKPATFPFVWDLSTFKDVEETEEAAPAPEITAQSALDKIKELLGLS